MADLFTSIVEEITLPNSNIERVVNTKTISGVNQIVRRVDTIATTFEGNGIGIIAFVDNEESQIPGSFVRTAVKYIRITNLDSTNYIYLYIIKTNQESVLFKIDAGKSFMMANAEFDASQVGNYVVQGYVDETYYSDFDTIDLIKAKADTADVKIEYFVASS